MPQLSLNPMRSFWIFISNRLTRNSVHRARMRHWCTTHALHVSCMCFLQSFSCLVYSMDLGNSLIRNIYFNIFQLGIVFNAIRFPNLYNQHLSRYRRSSSAGNIQKIRPTFALVYYHLATIFNQISART